MLDYWAWAHAENPKLREEVVSDDFEEDLAAMEAEVLRRQEAEATPPDPGDWEDVIDQEYGGGKAKPR